MKFIPPLEISSKIMTLIEESDKELILVSPYVNLSKWNKMKKCINRAVKRGVDISFIARKNATQDLSFLEQKGIKLILVNDLHAKLYLNESYGIVTSQNIVHYSDINSIDIAYKTTKNCEREELIEFINKYIINNLNTTNIVEDIHPHKNVINKVEENNYENVPQLKSWQLKKLSKQFTTTYDQVKFVPTTNYLFSGNLLPFSDIMISSIYTIKIRKKFNNCENIIDEISKIQFNFTHSFHIKLMVSHKSFYYLEFIPIKLLYIDNLISDYIQLTDKILNSNTIMNIASENNKNY